MNAIGKHWPKLITLGLLATACAMAVNGRAAPPDDNTTIMTRAPATAPAAAAPSVAAPGLENLFVNIADRTIPSVANIFTTKAPPRYARQRSGRRGLSPYGVPDLWRDFFAGPAVPNDGYDYDDDPQAERPLALGTGFVIEAFDGGGGLLLTNSHVVAAADSIKVKFTESDEERESPAEVLGTDPDLDVALLKVKTTRKLQAVALGDSERLRVGEWIAAVGNPFGHGHSVSHGIVSAKARSLPGAFGQFLQVDAPINPGNSGGPLVNLAGEVVGINNAIDARGPGIGFAIPINAVRSILPALKSSGRVDRGYIGLAVGPNPNGGAPIIVQVVPGQPAYQAGLHKGDAIAKIDGKNVRSPTDLVEAITSAPVGRKVTAEIERGGRTLHVDVRVVRRPDLRQARYSDDG